MDETVVRELQAQMNRERQNVSNYLYIGEVCRGLTLDGLGDFFWKQAQEEMEHSSKFANFLISKRIAPTYMNLMPTVVIGDSLPNLTAQVYDLEKQTTANLETLYEIAEGAQEYQVCAFLDPLLVEQIEEEQWSFDLMDLVQRGTDPMLINQIYK